MAQNILVFGSILIIFLWGNFLILESAIAVALSSEVEIDQAVQQQILDATVKISFFAPAVDEKGQIKQQIVNGQKQATYEGGIGLGTLVRADGETLIITHDHWRLLYRSGTFVEFHNSIDELLLTMSGHEFYDLIRYRDGGTMILKAPLTIVKRLRPTIIGSNIETREGDIVFIVYRHSGSIDELSVQAMVVTEIRDLGESRILEIRSQESKIVTTGNSGGGVWCDGQLVGNMWSTVMKQQTDDSGEIQPTSSSFAAQLPKKS